MHFITPTILATLLLAGPSFAAPITTTGDILVFEVMSTEAGRTHGFSGVQGGVQYPARSTLKYLYDNYKNWGLGQKHVEILGSDPSGGRQGGWAIRGEAKGNEQDARVELIRVMNLMNPLLAESKKKAKPDSITPQQPGDKSNGLATGASTYIAEPDGQKFAPAPVPKAKSNPATKSTSDKKHISDDKGAQGGDIKLPVRISKRGATEVKKDSKAKPSAGPGLASLETFYSPEYDYADAGTTPSSPISKSPAKEDADKKDPTKKADDKPKNSSPTMYCAGSEDANNKKKDADKKDPAKTPDGKQRIYSPTFYVSGSKADGPGGADVVIKHDTKPTDGSANFGPQMTVGKKSN